MIGSLCGVANIENKFRKNLIMVDYIFQLQPGEMSSDQQDDQNLRQQSQSPLTAPITHDQSAKRVLSLKKKFIVVIVLLTILSILVISNHFHNNDRLAVMQLASSFPIQRPAISLTEMESPLQQANPQQNGPFSSELSEEVKNNVFMVPRQLWIYGDQNGNETLLVQRCLANIKHFAKMSNFTVVYLNQGNFQHWVSEKRRKTIQQILASMISHKQKEDEQYYRVRQDLISLSVLHENGGILIAKNLVLTENFTWIQHITSNPYVNKGSKTTLPQYIAFFDINAGSIMEIVNKKFAKNDYDRYMIRFPGINSNFLVAIRGGQFLSNVLQEYKRLIQNKRYMKSMMVAFDMKMGLISQDDLYSKTFTIAAHIVLQVKQFQLSKRFSDISKVNLFAVDYYGLMTINQRYYFKKIANIFDNLFEQKIFGNLAFYTLEELQQTTGPLRYVSFLIFEKELNSRLIDLTQNKNQPRIHPQSFIAKYLLLGEDQYNDLLQSVIQKNIVNITAKSWDTLPKLLWLFWNQGFTHASIGNQICIENLKRSAVVAGFEVREINNSNIVYYIGKDMNALFDRVIQNRKIATFPPTKSNFVRKAIIYKYGGIYLDVSYIAMQSLDWVINIARYPSQYIFNRYGELPRMLMFFHPHYGQPFKWVYDQKANTKRMDLTAYENNLIIAEPNHELLAEWIDEYALTITSDYKDTRARMEKYRVAWDSWTNQKDLYLTSMDSLKNVIGRRQNELDEKAKEKDYDGPRSASEYYGLWSMSGYRGQQKIRIHSNFDNNYYRNPQSSDNVFLYRYSQEYTQGILGKANQMIKLYNWNLRHLTELIDRDFDKNFTQEVHPDSYCMRYLIGPVRDRIYKQIQLLKLRESNV